MMKFRLSNGIDWAHEFEISPETTEQLEDGIKRAWREYILSRPNLDWDRLGHPDLAYRARIGQITEWITERVARKDVDEETQQNWTRQAAHWTRQAERELGGVRESSPLTLHVETPEGEWIAPLYHLADSSGIDLPPHLRGMLPENLPMSGRIPIGMNEGDRAGAHLVCARRALDVWNEISSVTEFAGDNKPDLKIITTDEQGNK